MGGLRVEDGRIDLKKYGLFPIVSMARTLCVRHGLAMHATSERLEALARTVGSAPELDAFAQDHAVMMAALLRQQASDVEAGLKPSNRLDPKLLAKDELDRLRGALRHVRSIPDLLRNLMFAS